MGRSGCDRSLTHQSTDIEQQTHVTAMAGNGRWLPEPQLARAVCSASRGGDQPRSMSTDPAIKGQSCVRSRSSTAQPMVADTSAVNALDPLIPDR